MEPLKISRDAPETQPLTARRTLLSRNSLTCRPEIAHIHLILLKNSRLLDGAVEAIREIACSRIDKLEEVRRRGVRADK